MKIWKKIGEKAYKLDYRKVVKRTFLTSQNKEVSFDITLAPDVAVVLALTSDNKVVLAKQFRPACEKVLLEMPGEEVEKNQKPIEAIEQELLEETGYKGKLK